MTTKSNPIPNRLYPSHVANPAHCGLVRHQWHLLARQYLHRFCCVPPQNRHLVELATVRAREKSPSPGDLPYLPRYTDLYQASLSILACSAAYDRADDVIRCGTVNSHGRFSCSDKHLCWSCCQRHLRNPLLIEFGGAYSAEREVYYLVISLASSPDANAQIKCSQWTSADRQSGRVAASVPPFEYGVPFTTEADVEQCRIYWDIFADVVRNFCGTKRGCCFAGGVGGPELAVKFQPLRVLPHCNFIVWSAGLTHDDLRRLRNAIAKKLRNCRRLPHDRYPHIAAYRLQAPDDLHNVIRYITKPIALAAEYCRIAGAAGVGIDRLIALNEETKTFLRNLPIATRGLPRMLRMGVCHPQSNYYIGVISDVRDRQRRRRAARKCRGAGAKPKSKKAAGSGANRRRKGRFPYWYAANCHAPMPPFVSVESQSPIPTPSPG